MRRHNGPFAGHCPDPPPAEGGAPLISAALQSAVNTKRFQSEDFLSLSLFLH